MAAWIVRASAFGVQEFKVGTWAGQCHNISACCASRVQYIVPEVLPRP